MDVAALVGAEASDLDVSAGQEVPAVSSLLVDGDVYHELIRLILRSQEKLSLLIVYQLIHIQIRVNACRGSTASAMLRRGHMHRELPRLAHLEDVLWVMIQIP